MPTRRASSPFALLTPFAPLTAALLAALLAGACSGSPAQPDASSPADARSDCRAPNGVDPCRARCHDFVIDRLIVPETLEQAESLGVDLNHYGQNDNALGYALSGLEILSIRVQPHFDRALREGLLSLALRIDAHALTQARYARVQLFSAEAPDCCAGALDGPARARCARRPAFQCDDAPQPLRVRAQSRVRFAPQPIADSTLQPGPVCWGQIEAPGVLLEPLVFKSLRLRARYDGTNLVEGVLNGVITRDSIEKSLLVLVAALMQYELDNALPGSQKWQNLRKEFDPDHDGVVTTAEVDNNEFFRGFLGDVMDNDGRLELSFGFGFHARPAVIVDP